MYKILGSYSSTSLTYSVFFPLEMTITEHEVPAFTPRSKVQPRILNKPIKTSKSIVKTESGDLFNTAALGRGQRDSVTFSSAMCHWVPYLRAEFDNSYYKNQCRISCSQSWKPYSWVTQRHSAGFIQAKSLDGQAGNCSFEKELTVNLWVNTASAVARILKQFHTACSKWLASLKCSKRTRFCPSCPKAWPQKV